MRTVLFPLLAALSLCAVSCKKESINKYASKMDGVHKWKGSYDYSFNPVNGSPSSGHEIVIDSAIEIQVYDNYIVFGNTSMSFESQNTTDRTLRYSRNEQGTLSYYSVTYYYDADSISYRYSHTLGQYGSEYMRLTTP